MKGFIRNNYTSYASTQNKEHAAKLEASELKYVTLDTILQDNFNEYTAINSLCTKQGKLTILTSQDPALY